MIMEEVAYWSSGLDNTTEEDIITNVLRNSIEAIVISSLGFLSINSTHGGSYVKYEPTALTLSMVQAEVVEPILYLWWRSPCKNIFLRTFMQRKNCTSKLAITICHQTILMQFWKKLELFLSLAKCHSLVLAATRRGVHCTLDWNFTRPLVDQPCSTQQVSTILRRDS